MKNIEQTIQDQFSNSPTLVTLIQNMNENIDPTADIDAFFNLIFNVNTALGMGLDIWGRIVNVSRSIATSPATILEDDDYKQLIFLKALVNITRSTVPATNQLLRNWLGANARAYVNDLGNMMIRYTFEFELTDAQRIIVQKSGIFPRPEGVGAYILQSQFPVFGFKGGGPYYTGFNQAAFIAEDATSVIE